LVSNEEILAASQAVIFPNPSNGLFNIQLAQLNGNVQVNIYDHLARLVSSQQESSFFFQVDINRASGLYFIEILYEDGKREMHKVIKE